jgi:predicted SAM-dependent methyltransferase
MPSLIKKHIRRQSRRVWEYLRPNKHVRLCPICSWAGRQFTTGGEGTKLRLDSRCPRCGSLERHRLAYMVAAGPEKLDYSSVLHVAPEQELSKWLCETSNNYLSIDLYAEAMANMDITNLQIDSDSQSLVWASHVLEHVIDDRKAISEIYRVLVPGGKALIQVPIWRLETFEDFTATTPEQRSRSFYQQDHVRLYGLDIKQRFENQGFVTKLHRAQDFGPSLLLKHGLSFASTNEVFIFTKSI